jgi:phosphoribosylanthranilate isomerase
LAAIKSMGMAAALPGCLSALPAAFMMVRGDGRPGGTMAATGAEDFPNPSARAHVKICGLTRREDARLALELGASFLGLILTRKSPRHLPPERAKELVCAIREEFGPQVRFIGVFVDEPPEQVAALAEELGLFAVQVHGDVEELCRLLPAERIIPALSIRDEADAARADVLCGKHAALLADAFAPGAHGGTGKVFDHRLVRHYFPRTRLFIAGGLKPENIAGIVQALGGQLPYAFDLSSGVEESPGIKSPEKLRRFFTEYEAALPQGERA